MGSIHRPLYPGSGSIEDTNFIQCVDGHEPQIHAFWCLGLDNITRRVHPTALVEVISGTDGDFLTNYLPKNGRRIQIIGHLSVNNNVQILGVPAQAWGRGLPFLCNLQAPNEVTVWVIGKYSNQEWGGSMFKTYKMTHVTLGASVDASPFNLL